VTACDLTIEKGMCLTLAPSLIFKVACMFLDFVIRLAFWLLFVSCSSEFASQHPSILFVAFLNLW
jgi:hypothetical protein